MEEAIILGAKKAIKMLSDSGQIGKTETKTIYNDPNNKGVDIFGDGNKYIYASADVINLQNVTVKGYTPKIGVLDWPNTIIYEGGATPNIYDFVSNAEEEQVARILAFVIPSEDVSDGTLAVGTYILAYFDDGSGIYSLTAETIHPIDPKYLPASSGGGGLPHLTLQDTQPIPGETVDIGPQDAAKLFDLMKQVATTGGLPLILTSNMGPMVSAICTAIWVPGDDGTISSLAYICNLTMAGTSIAIRLDAVHEDSALPSSITVEVLG